MKMESFRLNNGNHMNGTYEGCASRVIVASKVAAGSSLTTFCNVSLTQRVNFTTTGARGEQVPPQAIKNCSAALGTSVPSSTTTLVAGTYSRACDASQCRRKMGLVYLSPHENIGGNGACKLYFQ